MKTYNIPNHIRRIKNDVKDSYNKIAEMPTKNTTSMPNVKNIASLANTINNMYFGVNHVKERSNGGRNYDFLFHGFDNDILNLDILRNTNIVSAKNMFLNATNLSNQSVENIIDWIPNYSQISNPHVDTLEYFGLDQNLRDNISENFSINNLIPKGWRVRDYYNYVLAYTLRNADPNIPGDEPEVITKFFQESATNGWQKRGEIVINNATGVTRTIENNANWIRNELNTIYPISLDIQGTAGTKDFSKMFYNSMTLRKITNLDISNAENVYMMFPNTRITLENFNINTAKIKNMAYGFQYINLADTTFDLSNCDNMYFAFYSTYGNNLVLKNVQNLPSWSYAFLESFIKNIDGIDFNDKENISYTFYDAYALKELPNLNLDSTRMAREAYRLFSYCRNITTLPLISTQNVVNAYNIFGQMTNLVTVPNFNFINVENFAGAFCDDSKITNLPNFNLSNVYTLTDTFARMTSLIGIPNYNTSNVLYFTGTFQGDSKLINVSQWNTQRGVNFVNMFENCYSMKTANNFQTNRGLNFYNMFTNCYNLQQVNNNSLNFSRANNMACMFNQCYNLTLSSLNNIINMLPNADRFEGDTYFENIQNKGLGYFGILNWYLAEICDTSIGNTVREKGYNLTNNVRDLTLKYIYNYTTVTNNQLKEVEVFETFANHTEDINIGMLNNSFNDLPRDQITTLNMEYISDTSNIPGICKDMTNLQTIGNFHNTERIYRMDYAFQNCINLTEMLPISSLLRLMNIYSADYMFDNCRQLEVAYIVTNMPYRLRTLSSARGMFRNCRNIKTIGTTIWNPINPEGGYRAQNYENLTYFDEMFANSVLSNCDNMIIGVGRSSSSNGTRAFADLPNLTSIENMNLSAYTTNYLFQNSINIGNISNSRFYMCWNTEATFKDLSKMKFINSNVTIGNNSNKTFENTGIINTEGINACTTTNGHYNYLFNGCKNLTDTDFNFGTALHAAYAYANCLNLTNVNTFNLSAATNILEIFAGDTKLTTNSIYNIINGLPRYEQVRSSNNGHGATLGYLGINNSKDHNLPWNVSKPARDKGWLLGDIAHIITGNYINGNNYVFNVYDAPDHKDVSNNGAFIREALINNARYIPFIQSITINNTRNIQDWSNFYQNWTNLRTIVNTNMNNITNGVKLFNNCRNIENIGNHNFNKLQNASEMFRNTRNINQQLNIDFSKLTNSSKMFENSVIKNIATFNLNIINCTNTENMFTDSNISNFINIYAPNAINTSYMFNNCKQLSHINNINIINTSSIPWMFACTPNLKQISSSINIPRVVSATCTFYSSGIEDINITATNLTHATQMFYLAKNLTNINISVPNLQIGFMMFNSTNISKASEILQNTPNLTNAYSMFENCKSITNIKNVNLPKLVLLNRMFNNCRNLQTIDGFRINHTGGVSYGFANCSNLTTINNFIIDTSSGSLSSLFYADNNLQFVNNSKFDGNGNGNNLFSGCYNLQALNNIFIKYSVSQTLAPQCNNLTDIINCEFDGLSNIRANFPQSPIKNIINTKLLNLKDISFEYFSNNPNLVQIKNIIWNSSNIYGLNTQNNNQPMPSWSANLFMNDINLTDIDIDVSNISNLSYYFKNDNKLVNINLQNLKPNANLTYAFSNTGLTNLNILSNIITSTPSPYLFSGCLKLNDINAWNNRTILTGTFDDCPLITTTPNNITITGGVSFKGCPNITNVLPLTIGVNQVFKYFPNSNNLTSTSLDNIANGLFNYKLVSNKTALKNSVVNILTDAQIANLSDYAKETIAHKYWIIPGYTANIILTTDIGNTSCVVNTNGFAVLNTSIIQASTINLTFFNGVSNMSNTIINQNHLHTLSIDSCENVKDINNTLKNVPLLTNLSGMDDLGLAFTNDTTVAQRTLNIAAAANLTMNSVNNLLNAIAYVRPESHINLNRNVLNLVNENTKRLINYKGWTLDGYTQNTPAKVIDLVTNREVFNLRTKHGGWLPAIDTNGKIYLHSTTKRDGTSDEMSLTITNRIGNTLNIIMNSSSEKGWDYLIVSKNGTEIYNAKKLETNNNNTPLNLSGLNVGDILTFNYTKDSSGSYGIDEYQLYFEQDLIE